MLRLLALLLSSFLLIGFAAESRADATQPALSALETARLARYGRWATVPPYGRVWQPTVDASWRPYSRGRWQHGPGTGWSWQGREPWASLTERGGRWIGTPAGWIWIPGPEQPTAPVAWAIAPDYIGWCPLGPDDRAAARLAPGSSSRGWTIVERARLGSAAVELASVPAIGLSRRIPFIVQRRGPAARPAHLTVASLQPMITPVAAEVDEASPVEEPEPTAAPVESAPALAEPSVPGLPLYWGVARPARRHGRVDAADPYAPHYEPHYAPRSGSAAAADRAEHREHREHPEHPERPSDRRR